MFSGKTEELIRRAKRAQIAKLSVQIFKPGMDTRYSDEAVVTHDQASLQCQLVESSDQLHLLAAGYEVVCIDEAQFMDEGVVEVANKLANAGTRVIIAGLDMDFSGKPFGPMPNLMAIAEFVTKVHAICVRTGSWRIIRTAWKTNRALFCWAPKTNTNRCRAPFSPNFKPNPLLMFPAKRIEDLAHILGAKVGVSGQTPSLEAISTDSRQAMWLRPTAFLP